MLVTSTLYPGQAGIIAGKKFGARGLRGQAELKTDTSKPIPTHSCKYQDVRAHKNFVKDPISRARMRELFREKRAVKDSIGRPAIALVLIGNF